jgi:hypothetical protein
MTTAPRHWLVHSGGFCELANDNAAGTLLLLGPMIAAPLIIHALGSTWPVALVLGVPTGAVVSAAIAIAAIGCGGW